jgi:hypothetical protein
MASPDVTTAVVDASVHASAEVRRRSRERIALSKRIRAATSKIIADAERQSRFRLPTRLF